ncbi:response regulator [Flavobacterium magnum]|uniref:Response regulator n=1 Tax=Flavobacterium magnum TaxID=2162713 RepID=A0A2S0RDS5_9FLAO|nr:response regulator [Flavobacterium magnum]AWA29826.1 response regulator [Flavobacterium magnum]
MTKQRILVVDDDKDDQSFLLEAINELYPSFICELADNGRDALEHIDKNPPPPDYIFLDLNMPLLNGYEFLKEYKKQPESSKSKIIVYSTSSHPQDKIATKDLGATDYITKLSDFRKLKQTLEQVFSDYRGLSLA